MAATKPAEMAALIERGETLIPRLEGLLENADALATMARIEAKTAEIQKALKTTLPKLVKRLAALEAEG